jgi:hypothetical protein
MIFELAIFDPRCFRWLILFSNVWDIPVSNLKQDQYLRVLCTEFLPCEKCPKNGQFRTAKSSFQRGLPVGGGEIDGQWQHCLVEQDQQNPSGLTAVDFNVPINKTVSQHFFKDYFEFWPYLP